MDQSLTHRLIQGMEYFGSLCGQLGPQNPFEPTEFYTIKDDPSCGECIDIWTIDLTTVPAPAIMAI